LLGSSSTASRVSRPGCRTSGHPERKLCILLQEFLSRFLGKCSLHCATCRQCNAVAVSAPPWHGSERTCGSTTIRCSSVRPVW
jgi:hypothetical protein